MSKEITIFICRHGQTDGNLVKDFKLPDSEKLNVTGMEQSLQLGQDILATKLKPEVMYVGPAERTRRTGEIVSDIMNVPIVIDDRLREFDFGIFKGQIVSSKEIYQHLPTIEDRFHFRLEHGESDADVVTRIDNFIRSIPKQNCIIVTHDFPAFVCKQLLEGKDMSQIMHTPFEPIPNGGYISITL